jgi:hypothetical protein
MMQQTVQRHAWVWSVCITVLSWALDPGGSLAAYIDKRDSTGTNGWCTIG